MIRPITDTDLVSTEYNNDHLLILFRTMYNINGKLFYELTCLPTKSRAGIYKIVVNFSIIKQPISIDFQELLNAVYEKDYK